MITLKLTDADAIAMLSVLEGDLERLDDQERECEAHALLLGEPCEYRAAFGDIEDAVVRAVVQLNRLLGMP